MRIKETKVYKFNELSDEAKDKAIGKLFDINTDNDWYDSVYDDAKTALIEITEFDLYRQYAHGDFMQSAEDTAKAIIENHGKDTETFKDATNYLKELSTLQGIHSIADMDDEDIDTSEIDKEFLNTLLEDYRIMLQHEYDYLNSREAIIETIEANDYEFTEDGNLD